MPITDKIDYDRGVIINTHTLTGMDVFMYADDPGNFLDAHGNVVPDSLAKESGYDIEKLGKEKLKKSRKQQAMSLIDAELADDKDIKEECVKELKGYKTVTTGLGRFHVLDPDDNRLNAHPLSAEQADMLMSSMAGAVDNVNEVAGSATSKKK